MNNANEWFRCHRTWLIYESFPKCQGYEQFFSVAILWYPVCNTLSNWKQTELRLHFSCVANGQLGLFLVTNLDSRRNKLVEYQSDGSRAKPKLDVINTTNINQASTPRLELNRANYHQFWWEVSNIRSGRA